MAAIFSLARAKKFSDWICEDASALDSSLEINADSLLAYRVLFPLLKSREDVVWILPSGTSFARFASLGKQSGADLTSHFFFMAQDAAQALLGLQQAIRNQAATIVLDMSDGFEGEQYQLLSALERIAQSGISVIAIRPLSEMRTPSAMRSRLAVAAHRDWLFSGHLFVTLKRHGIPLLRKTRVEALPVFEEHRSKARAFFSIAEREALASP